MCLPRLYPGNDAILEVVARFSKMAHFIPCRQNSTAEQTAQLFTLELVRLHRVLTSIVSEILDSRVIRGERYANFLK